MSPETRAALLAYKRRREGPTWYRVLERFGLPTLLVLVLVGNELRRSEADRLERRELLTAIHHAVARQTDAIDRLAQLEAEHALAVRLSWPKVHVSEKALRELRQAEQPKGEGRP